MEREFETKGLITKKDYDMLINSLEVVKCQNQINNYLDTDDNFFKTQNCALRLRHIDDTLVFSLKRSDNDGATEWNTKLNKYEYEQIIKNKAIDLRQFDCPFNAVLHNLSLITIKTTRIICMYKGQKIELDYTNFGTFVDYEIEIESDSLINATMILNQLITDFNLTIKKSYPKIARYHMY